MTQHATEAESAPRFASIAYWDHDRHGSGCRCGTCNANGKAYGFALKEDLMDLADSAVEFYEGREEVVPPPPAPMRHPQSRRRMERRHA